jgi:cell filamentation protein
VRIGKAASMFCYPEHIPAQLQALFADLGAKRFLQELTADAFAAEAARFLAALNAIHAFRDGNGRAQLAFLALLAARAEHPLALDRLDPAAFMAAMIASFQGDERPLGAQVRDLIARSER